MPQKSICWAEKTRKKHGKPSFSRLFRVWKNLEKLLADKLFKRSRVLKTYALRDGLAVSEKNQRRNAHNAEVHGKSLLLVNIDLSHLDFVVSLGKICLKVRKIVVL